MFQFSQLKYPLIQAPMAGGPNTADMISTVANLGAVGSYGFAYSNVEVIERDLRAARQALTSDTSGAINANFFVFSEVDSPEDSALQSAVDQLREIDDNAEPNLPQAPYFPNLWSQLEPVWAFQPEILTFHFGIPEPGIVEKAHSLNICVGISATSSQEAIQIENSGADFIVAQGIEAGGHRGIFDPTQADAKLPCIELISSLKSVTRLPLVAAGGIMTRSQIQQALAAGASAVQLGTAFLTTKESGASTAHKDYLLNKTDRKTVITRGFSGRPARGIDNQFIQQMQDKPVLPFPLQNTLTGKMRAAAVQDNNGEYQSLWAGSNFADCRDEDIATLIKRLFD